MPVTSTPKPPTTATFTPSPETYEMVSNMDNTDTFTFDPVTPVSEFIAAFEASKDPLLWINLVKEEHLELVEAMAEDIATDSVETLAAVLKETCDLLYVLVGFGLVTQGTGIDISNEFRDRVAETLAAVTPVFGPELMAQAFIAVHQSNMSKLGDDGKPIRREDGKVLKGPNYRAPNMVPFVAPIYAKMRLVEA